VLPCCYHPTTPACAQVMTKPSAPKQPSPKRASRHKPAHAITPTQAEFLMELRNYQLDHDQQGATGRDLANRERSLGMVRKLAMALSKADPSYIVSQISSHKGTDSGGKRKTVSLTRYRLTEQNFVRWPRTAVFLLQCRGFRRDENGNITKEKFAEHLKVNHGFTDAEFNEDWNFVLARNYIHEYESGFSTGLRIDAELQWLELLARAHKAKS
jgi:hypothetical protein